MKALSVRAPWWWFILHARKDVENRSWPTRFRGTAYLHAGKTLDAQAVIDLDAALKISGLNMKAVDLYPQLMAARGAIVGKVEIVGCIQHSRSPWFFGEHGFVLTRPVAFPRPVPCRGALSFFELPADVVAAVREQEASL